MRYIYPWLVAVFILLEPAGTSRIYANDAALEKTAERFFELMVEGKKVDAFQEFEMTETMRSWFQAGKHQSAAKDFRRQFGSTGELRKTEVIRHTPQIQSVELFYSGKTNSFKARVTFEGNRISGVHYLFWSDEQAHGGTPIQLATPTGTIFGTLLEPEQTTEPMPVVLILAGSGATDRNCNQLPAVHTNAYRMLAEALQQNGIASVRFDKRGVGASAEVGADESKLRFEHYVEDAALWLDRLSQEGKYSKIIVLGHSEGSLIGMLACLQSDKAAGFISLCGAGRPLDELLRMQMEQQPRAIKETFLPILDEWKQGRTVDNVPNELLSLARPGVQPYMISWLKYDPQEEIKKLAIPVLILQGTTDIQVSVTDAEELSKANPNAKKVTIKNMNHVLKTGTTTIRLIQLLNYADPKIPLHEELVPNITDFIANIK